MVARWWQSTDPKFQKKVLWAVLAVVLLGLFIAGSLKGSGSYSITVSGNGLGNFTAITVNTGSKAGSPECTVRAYDQFGNRIGFDIWDLPKIEPNEQHTWNGQVRVNELVARYDGSC